MTHISVTCRTHVAPVFFAILGHSSEEDYFSTSTICRTVQPQNTHNPAPYFFRIYEKRKPRMVILYKSVKSRPCGRFFFSRSLGSGKVASHLAQRHTAPRTPPVRCHLHTPQRRSTSLSFSRFDKITHRSLIIFSLPWL